MSRLFSCVKFFSTIIKAIMIVSFLCIVLQTPKLNAESLVEKAKKEGKLMLYTGWNIPDTQIIADAFMKKYPFIKLDYIRHQSTARMAKLLMEKQMGRRICDVTQALAVETHILKKEGLIQKYVSPETKDWPEGFKDPEGYWAAYYISYNSWVYNTRMVSEEEAPKRYEDLLDPKWKGKIGMGSVEAEWYQGVMNFMGREKGLQFMKRLAAQEIRVNSGKTLTMQLMASGEFPIAKGILHNALQMKKKGAPIQWIIFPTPILGAIRAPVLHADAPHPNAGKLFIDYTFSREGQTLLNELDRPPVRMDIKVDPVLEKVRRNQFAITSPSAEETQKYKKEFFKIFSIR